MNTLKPLFLTSDREKQFSIRYAHANSQMSFLNNKGVRVAERVNKTERG